MTESEGQKTVNEMLGKLSPQDQEKLHRLLADKEATDRLLSTPEAQALMRQLMGKQGGK